MEQQQRIEYLCMDKELEGLRETPSFTDIICSRPCINTLKTPEWQEMEQQQRGHRCKQGNFSKQIKQQVVLTLNFRQILVTTIRCSSRIINSPNGITGEGQPLPQPPSRPVSRLVQEPILVKTAFQGTIILTLTNSGRNNSKMAIPGKILLDLGSKIITIINNHLQQYSHLLCRNKIIRLFLARLTSHLVIVITRELLIMCNSAKIGQLSE